MTRSVMRRDVYAALADARGARQATLFLQDRINTLAAEIEALKSLSLQVSVLRATLGDHLDGAHVGVTIDHRGRRRRRQMASTETWR